MSLKRVYIQLVVSLISIIFMSGCISSSMSVVQTSTTESIERMLPTVSVTTSFSVTPKLVNTPIATKISTPTSIQFSPKVSASPSPLPPGTPTSKPPSGWIAYCLGDGIAIIHTSGLGRRIINSQLMHIQNMDWSPDGQNIAVIGKTNWYGNTEIYLIASDGSAQTRVTYLRDNIGDIAWFRDGKSLVFSTETEIYLYELTPPRVRKLINDLNLKYIDVEYATQSDKIVFTDYQQRKVWIMNNDGSDLRVLFEKLDNMGNDIAVSPDGTRIAITSENGLMIINLDGSHSLQATLNQREGYDAYPDWSPDGNWVVFQSVDGLVPTDIYIIEVNGQGLIKLVSRDNEYISCPVWFPFPGLDIGKEFSVTKLGTGLKLYATTNPGGDVLATLKKDDVIMVLEGPVENEAYLWWFVRLANDGLEGWVIDTPGWWQLAK